VKRITDPTFVYVPSVKTDIAKTFARVRREMKADAAAKALREAEAAGKVAPIKRRPA
jgi:hypothetical protein